MTLNKISKEIWKDRLKPLVIYSAVTIVLPFITSILFKNINISEETSMKITLIVNFLFQSFFMCYGIIHMKNYLKTEEGNCENIKQFSWKILKGVGMCFLYVIVASAISNSIFTKAGIDIVNSINQQSIEELLKNYPISTLLLCVVFGPLGEEFIFRYCFIHNSNHKWLCVLLSSAFFAILHLNNLSPQELINFIVYFAAGLALANIYVKNDDIRLNYAIHSLYNLILAVLKII